MSDLLSRIHKIKCEEKKALAVLIDPDQDSDSVVKIAQLCRKTEVDFIFVGGSLVSAGILSDTILQIRENYSGPVYIFPGNEFMVDALADGILFLSLLSGRNPEYLIGKQIVAAPMLVHSGLDIVPTAYLLIDGGRETSVSYISNTKPIPSDKPDIASATALAGKMLGMQCIYMDAGSGAIRHIPARMIAKVRKDVQLPLIIGGGIRQAETALELYKAGADVLVIGNGAEENHDLIQAIVSVRNAIGIKVEV
jgi:phosphoglycerol geranylgeranyltransferase